MSHEREFLTNATPYDSISTLNPKNVLEFLYTCGHLKTEKRTGWMDHKVNQPESIADHMYRMAIISFLIQDPKLSREKCMKLCLVHDMSESLVGDITPYQGISKEEKHLLEKEAMDKIRKTIPGRVGDEIFDLWMDYESGSSEEARLVKEIDKFEMIVQALEYEKAQGLCLQSFFDYVKSSFHDPQIISWVEELRKERNSLKEKFEVTQQDNESKNSDNFSSSYLSHS
jgi:putative hydrolase of HD superfamily